MDPGYPNNINCSQLPGPLEPYGDIAGLGVILGFVVSAWLTVLILVAYYIFAFDPNGDPFLNPDEQNSTTTLHAPNPADKIGKNFKGGPVENAFYKRVDTGR
ncbi:hypothetical protein LZ32DRAFT_673911 [Colletotrichum eremochloae]|nr:hypothetical protein LZ32DRAFT_673911 [Colletotrichum eremochloae]